MKQAILIALFGQIAMAMLIPEDAEMLDGYGYISYPEISPDDDYFEARSLSAGPLYNSVRDKRSINHEVHESNGLVSHFRPNTVNGFVHSNTHSSGHAFRKIKKWLRKKFEEGEEFREKRDISSNMRPLLRQRRSVDDEQKSKTSVTDGDKANKLPESLADRPLAAALVGKFTRSPFEYSKIQHEEDSMAMDTSPMSANEGIKSRTPRVNFVTQQKKSIDHDDTKVSATKSDFYKTPPLLHNSKESTAASSNEKYPERSSTMRPTYDYKDQNSNRYDDRYIEDMYPPPPPEMYDPMFNYNAPYDMMHRFPYNGYNNYPGNRYDIPDYPMYGNEIDNRYYMRSDMMQPPLPSSSALPRKRTIYYAYLPEVVRSPPTVDFRYRSYDRYDPYYYNPYEANMVSSTYRRPMYDRLPISERPMKHDYRSSRPMKINTNDATRTNTSVKEKRFDQERSNQKSNEYDSFYY